MIAPGILVVSSMVECVQSGKRFEVFVVDSRLAHTGESTAARLLAAGIATSYLPINGVSHAMKARFSLSSA